MDPGSASGPGGERREGESRFVDTLASDGCSFSVGCAAAIAQVVLVRELFGALEGHEVSVALSLAAWVAGLALGASLGGAAAGRWRIDAGHLLLAVAALAAAAAGGVVLLRDARPLLDVPRGGAIGVAGSAALALLAVVPAAVVTGALLPLFARASEPPAGLRCGPARFYAVDALGTAVGGAISPLLVAWMPAPRLLALFHALAAAALVLAAAAGRARPRHLSRWAGGIALAALAALAASSDPLEHATQARRRAGLGAGGRIVRTVESPYERIDVATDDRGGGQVTVLGNGTVVAVAPDPYGAGPALDVVLLEHPAPRDVLVVGSSPPDAVRAAQAHGAAAVSLATVDPWVLAELRRALGPADRALVDRARRPAVDARAHVRAVPPGSFDVIAVFAPDPLTALANRFYTREAFAEAARALRPGGVLALRLPWSANVPDAATLAYGRSVARALRASFGHVVAMPGIDALLFASRDPSAVTVDPETLAARAAARPGLAGLPYPPGLFADAFPPDRTAQLRELLGLAEPIPGPANADLRPVAYLERMLALLTRTSAGLRDRGDSRLARAFRRLTSLPPWVPPAAFLLVPLAALLVRRRPAAFTGPETLALGCFVGAAGMALQLLLLIAYQVRTGRLYVGYAVLTAAFMLGVAAGARLGDRLLRCRGWGPRPALVRLETLAAGALLALWAASAAVAASPPLLLAGTIVAGLLTGVPFPALVALARISGRSPARAGAWASAGDSLGALVGALAATLVLLPAHGFAASLLILAAARAAGALTAAVRNA